MNDDEAPMLDCDIHGRGVAAVVCRHPCEAGDDRAGFVENSSVAGDYQACCALIKHRQAV